MGQEYKHFYMAFAVNKVNGINNTFKHRANIYKLMKPFSNYN